MPNIINRYNAFIPEPGKAGHYSCPICYALSKKAATGTDITCPCGFTGPIIANPAMRGNSAIRNTGSAVMEFKVEALYAATLQHCRCPKCRHVSEGSAGAYSWDCPSCHFVGPVSYRDVCNACLMGGNGNPQPMLVKAQYLCANPIVSHSHSHNKGLVEAGKCEKHHCSQTCKPVTP